MSLPELLYTPEEVAAILKVGRRTVYQWLLKHKLEGFHAGKGWRISQEQLEAFLNARQA